MLGAKFPLSAQISTTDWQQRLLAPAGEASVMARLSEAGEDRLGALELRADDVAGSRRQTFEAYCLPARGQCASNRLFSTGQFGGRGVQPGQELTLEVVIAQ
jgi:hypothetical protein